MVFVILLASAFIFLLVSFVIWKDDESLMLGFAMAILATCLFVLAAVASH